VSRQPRRNIASSTSLFQAASEAQARSVFDYHTVEDLHGMSAADLLAEPETRTDSKMRHFTGELDYKTGRWAQLIPGFVQLISG
jgi:hypothetical protein